MGSLRGRCRRDLAQTSTLEILADTFVGDVIALMGPSGCGKTTLLNVLAHRTVSTGARVTAELRVNSEVMSLATFRSIASYVEQEDALIGSLTTSETIEIAAHLARPRYVSSFYSQSQDEVVGKFPRECVADNTVQIFYTS